MSLRGQMVAQIDFMDRPRGNAWNREGAEAIVDQVVLPLLRELYGHGFLTAEGLIKDETDEDMGTAIA